MAKNIAAPKSVEGKIATRLPLVGPGNLARACRNLAALALLFVASTGPEIRAQGADSTPIRIQASRAFNPVFPYEALIAGKGGFAEIDFTVDYTGRAILLSTRSATDRAFAMSFQAEIEAIEFIPPRRNGQPQMSLTRERYDFPPTPALDNVAREILTELRKPNPAIPTADQLDAKPEPIRQPPPAYPWVLRGDELSGEAVIEFIVDRNGRCLFPRIVSSSHEDFGWAAATGVLRWKYKPPTKGGAKVDARVTTTVVFDLKKAAEMW